MKVGEGEASYREILALTLLRKHEQEPEVGFEMDFELESDSVLRRLREEALCALPSTYT